MLPIRRHNHALARWPAWSSRWLGYRSSPPAKRPDYLIWFWSFIGAFCGLSIVQGVLGHAHYFIERGVPSIVASYAASAVLIYGAIEAPLAQPRPLLCGHFIGAVVGVCITKLFRLLPPENFQQLQWLAGSLACATAIVVMQMTATTHPPGGATALLAATNQEIIDLSWYYLPVILLSSFLVLAVALLINNIQRRYPLFWIEPAVVISAPVAPELGGSESVSEDTETRSIEGTQSQLDDPTKIEEISPV